ncbi:glycoside hydrolase family 43 protein [Deinococcus cellulosilyticus]|uniref:Endo-1,4-beta-xylanase n=1 Tax=Deinococcus cellulosilyticus (strain DSM 18568 / NBRC 106333 / KACC 11606 / 5516J-15) TaxID=1223518 RepID=A0A511MZI4_DEIC1|nr:glycoside hydrolase family 43 protein [Deinococcus cellulosilyticus]GEM46040.1 endo-1,4-beta-xylanase [Deinococcus cellulosilyticus NBRC 106333 = KACC 11606]
MTSLNPLYPDYFADPFILKHQDRYYAFGTGRSAREGMAFEVLTSPDLQKWESLGGALLPVAGFEEGDYWAPEVAHHNGKFYMYYSVGHGDKGHHLRVAVSDRPEGPYQDQDIRMVPNEPFAIDPSPFQDEDGQWYLYYARDFLDGERVGTALVVDRLKSMTELEGNPQVVLRASQDWQIYQRDREMYGRTFDWHTLEGPFVVRRNGKYYCFYSGGAWINDTYGVNYAVAEHPLGPWVEPHNHASILNTHLTGLTGPGHNSVIVTHDGSDGIVFHAWDDDRTRRQLYILPLVWTPEGPRVERSPTVQVQS